MSMHGEAVSFILSTYNVDIGDYLHESYKEVNSDRHHVAVIALDLALRIVDCQERAQRDVGYLSDHLRSRWAGDPGYLQSKATDLREIYATVNVCRDVLRLVMQGFKP